MNVAFEIRELLEKRVEILWYFVLMFVLISSDSLATTQINFLSLYY